MSVLSDGDIRRYVEGGRLVIEPFDEAMLQPASYDVKLAAHFLTVPTGGFFVATHYVLSAGDFLLGSTFERVEIPADLVCRIEGKSSLGRRGLMVHSTAGFVDPGFRGNLTLELKNLTQRAIALESGMLIAQLSFELLLSEAERPYGSEGLGSRYQDQEGPEGAR